MYSNTPKYNVIGIMSGTSLDGLDLAACTFHSVDSHWTYSIVTAETLPYPSELKEQLSGVFAADARHLSHFHALYGHYLGKQVANFTKRTGFPAHFVASHGHTIFHDPKAGFTTQIGDGAAIAMQSSLPVVCDFRTSDVAAGGQGAPLVPIGDKLLFSNYDACLNLGGIANISMDHQNQRIAYDICPVNMALNYFTQQLGLDYDADGAIARSGKTIQKTLDALKALDYFSQPFPKTLGREWFETEMLPLLRTDAQNKIPDILHTCVHLAASEIAATLNQFKLKNALITGGGAFNSFLIHCIRQQTDCKITLPEPLLINFKEALIFAFLGVLRWTHQTNCLASVTGASKNVTGGAIYLP